MNKSFLNYVCDVILLGYEVSQEEDLMSYIIRNKKQVMNRLNFETNDNSNAIKKLVQMKTDDFRELSDYVNKYYASLE